MEVALTLDFGRGGNAEHHLGPGWSAGEAGYRWMVGERSELWLDNPGADRDCILELDLHPFVAAPELTAQRLDLAVRGAKLGAVRIDTDAVLAWRLPAALLRDPAPIRVVLHHPDALSPKSMTGAADDRLLSVSARAGRLYRMAPQDAARARPLAEADADAPPSELAMWFESLGDNCEFGLVQRRCGQEPLGLLRFANIELRHLLQGLRTEFAGLGEAGTLRLQDDEANREYVVRDSTYGITYHTFLYKDQVSEEGLLAQQATRLRFLVRKLMGDVQSAEKIFVLKRNQPLSEQEVLPLYATLRARGPNTLLFVVPADEAHPPGTVETLAPGLLRGYIDRFAPPANAHDLSFEPWLTLCRAALRAVAPRKEAVGA